MLDPVCGALVICLLANVHWNIMGNAAIAIVVKPRIGFFGASLIGIAAYDTRCLPRPQRVLNTCHRPDVHNAKMICQCMA